MNTDTANTASESTSDESAIEVSGLTKRFGSTLAVDGLSLAVKRGSTLGLIGPNGAGKSTTIKMVMGLLTPSVGTVRVLGRSVREDSAGNGLEWDSARDLPRSA